MNPFELYLDTVGKYFKWQIERGESQSQLIVPELFSKGYIGNLIGDKDNIISDDCLNIFMKFIDLDSKIIYREFNKFSTEEWRLNYVNQVVSAFLETPYKVNKLLKLKLYVDVLDKIVTRISGSFDPNNKMRIEYLLKKIFRQEGYLEDRTISRMLKKYGITDPAINDMFVYHNDNIHMTYKEFYEQEKYILSTITELLSDEQRTYKLQLEGTDLDEHQINSLQGVMAHNISIITGGPGTGKSKLVGSILAKHPGTLVLAPTGCAVENIQNNYPEYELSCFTIHSFYYRLPNFSGQAYERSLEKLAAFISAQEKLIVIDEFSMVDIFLLAKVFHILEKYKHQIKYVLVGDPEQLPSIKMGQLLLDFIRSGKIPTYTLSRCYRSKDGIIRVLNHIKDKNRLGVVKDSVILFQKEDLFKNDPYEYFSSFDRAIISPTNEEVNEINKTVQSYNKNQEICRHKYGSFKKGDKVVFLKNEPKSGLFNGTMLVLCSAKKTINLTKGYDLLDLYFTDSRGRTKTFSCSTEELPTYLKLCYAITVHKVQGHEYNEIYLSFCRFPRIMYDRKLLYTAISRAKERCYICGDISDIQNACQISREKISSIPQLFTNPSSN